MAVADRRRGVERAKAASNLRGELLSCTFAGYAVTPENREGFEAARVFAERPEGWLALVGTCGMGKTHLLAAIANRLLESDLPPLYVVVPDLLDYVRSGMDVEVPGDRPSERMRQVMDAPLLLLDDLAAEVRSSWTDEQVFRLLNYRYNGRMPTVVASNVLLGRLEPRIASRLGDRALCRQVVMVGQDYRERAERERRGGGAT